jgi:hypothetical protein
MTGTGKATIETLQRLVDAFNAHDLDAVTSFFTDDPFWSCHVARIRGPRGSRGGRRCARGWQAGSPASPTSTTARTVTGSAATAGDKIARKDSYWTLVER